MAHFETRDISGCMEVWRAPSGLCSSVLAALLYEPGWYSKLLPSRTMTRVFHYGSNCDEQRLNSRERLGGAAHSLGRAQNEDNFEISFDVWSPGNNCAIADLIQRGSTPAWGVLYDIPEDYIDGSPRPDGRRTLKQMEGPKYEKQFIKVTAKGQAHSAVTFLVRGSESAVSQLFWSSLGATLLTGNRCSVILLRIAVCPTKWG